MQRVLGLALLVGLGLHGCRREIPDRHMGEQEVSAEERHKRQCDACPDMDLHKDIRDEDDKDDDKKAARGKEMLTAIFCVNALHGDDAVRKIAPRTMACFVQKIAQGAEKLSEVAHECAKEEAKVKGMDEGALKTLTDCLDHDGTVGRQAERAEAGDGLRERFANGFIKSQELAQLFEPPKGEAAIRANVKPLQWDMVNKLMIEFRYAIKYMVQKYLRDLDFEVEDAITAGKSGTAEYKEQSAVQQDSHEVQSRAEHEPPGVHPRAQSPSMVVDE